MDVVKTIAPVFIALGLGMLCRRINLLSREGVSALKRLAINITLPATTFSAFLQADYSGNSLLIPPWIFLCCCLSLLMGFGAKRLFRMKERVTPFLCSAFEGGMLGFPLYTMLYGTLAPFAILNMGQCLYIFTVYRLMITGERSARALLRDAVASPVLWTLALGVLLGATGLYDALEPSGVKGLLDTALAYVAAPTGFLILLTIGYDFRPSEIPWGRTLRLVAVRLSIMAVLLGASLLANRYLLGGAMETGAIWMLFSLPAPFVLPVFADDPKERAFLSSTLSVMTCVTVLLFTAMVVVLK